MSACMFRVNLLMDIQENQCNQIIIEVKILDVPKPYKTLIFVNGE